MKKLLGLLVLFICLNSSATNVQWGLGEHYEYLSSVVEGGQGYYMVLPVGSSEHHLDFIVHPVLLENGGYRLDFYGPTIDYAWENIATANEGDVITVSGMRELKHGDCLIHNNIDDGIPSSGKSSIEVDPGITYYLAFVTTSSYSTGDDSVVGWLTYTINQDEQLLVYMAAYDADGGPMIVGGGSALIPEPSSGLLLILGSALLFLRRQSLLHDT